MIMVSGKGSTASELPIGLSASRDYFADISAFLLKIEAVDKVKPLGRPGAYLVTHHPVGGLNYHVVMVSCMQSEWHEGGMRLRPLDFETDQIKCEHPVVKGFIEADLSLADRGLDKTSVEFQFSVGVELPLVGGLRMLPRPLVRATADGIMNFKVGLIIQSLFRKVLDDFSLEAVVPAASDAARPV
jgi:hypothetical protein